MRNYEEWYNEAVSNPETKTITTSDGRHAFYKGFKLSCIKEQYSILDLRKIDFYSPVTTEDLKVFIEHGFVRGANYLMFVRDVKRIALYTKRLDRLHKLLADFEKKLSLNITVDFCKKRIRNCKDNIVGITELLEFHTERFNKINKKFNFNLNVET